MYKLKQAAATVIGVSGFILMLGAAGAGDIGTMSLKQIFVRLLIGLALILIGVVVGGRAGTQRTEEEEQ